MTSIHVHVIVDGDQLGLDAGHIGANQFKEKVFAAGELELTAVRQIRSKGLGIAMEVEKLCALALSGQFSFPDCEITRTGAFAGFLDEYPNPVTIQIQAEETESWFYPGTRFLPSNEVRLQRVTEFANLVKGAIGDFVKAELGLNWTIGVDIVLVNGVFA